MSNDLFAGYFDADFVCVGSIADEKSDNAYFLFTNAHSTAPIKIDTIVQQNIITGQTTPVVVDVWQVTTATGSIGWGSVNGSTGTPFTELPITTVSATVDASGITTAPEISINNLRVNMTFGVSGVNCKGLKIKEIGTDQIFLYDSHTCDFTAANSQGYGYCVFAEVVEGMDVVEKIKGVATGNMGMHQDVPLEDVIIESAEIVE